MSALLPMSGSPLQAFFSSDKAKTGQPGRARTKGFIKEFTNLLVTCNSSPSLDPTITQRSVCLNKHLERSDSHLFTR
jgi:hypothetical protein